MKVHRDSSPPPARQPGGGLDLLGWLWPPPVDRHRRTRAPGAEQPTMTPLTVTPPTVTTTISTEGSQS
ncbi:MAG: hypothetical protein ACYCSF_01465 [Acidimicrobiales bacterium]